MLLIFKGATSVTLFSVVLRIVCVIAMEILTSPLISALRHPKQAVIAESRLLFSATAGIEIMWGGFLFLLLQYHVSLLEF